MKYQFNERKYDAYTLLNYTVSVANKQVVTIIIFCWLVFLVTSSLEELGYIITLYIGKYWLVQGTYSSILLQSNKLTVRVFSFTFMSNKFPREITTTSVTIWCVTNCSSLVLLYIKRNYCIHVHVYIYLSKYTCTFPLVYFLFIFNTGRFGVMSIERWRNSRYLRATYTCILINMDNGT